MTSVSTLVERLRRASAGADPLRDAAVVLSEFLDDGGLEPIDDPFHPARRDAVTGPTAILARTQEATVVLARSTEATPTVPQCQGLPIAVAVLDGRLTIEVYSEGIGDALGSLDHTMEVRAGEVYVLEADVIHRLHWVVDHAGLAIHAVLGDLRSASRARWVGLQREIVERSDEYPLADADR